MTFNTFPKSEEFSQKAKEIYFKNLYYLLDKIDKENKYKVEMLSYEKNKELLASSDYFKSNEIDLLYNNHVKHLKSTPIFFKKEPTYYEILSNLQIACELFLKKIIFDISPYALIDLKSYPKNSKPIDFSKTPTADAQYLYKASVFFVGKEYFNTAYNEEFESLYDKNRDERNSYLHRDSNKLTDGLTLLRAFIIVNDIFIKDNVRKSIYKYLLQTIPEEDYKNRHNNKKRCSFFSIARYDSDMGNVHKVFYEEARFKYLKSMSYIYESLKNNEREIFFKYKVKNHIDDKNRYFCPNCTMYTNIYLNKSNYNNYKEIFEEYKNNKYLKSLINIDIENKIFKCFCCNDTYIIEKPFKHRNCKVKRQKNNLNFKLNDMCLNCGEENLSDKKNNSIIYPSNDNLFLLRKHYRKNRVKKTKS